MNKKDIVTKKNVGKVAKFLKESCEYFKKDGDGCRGLKLSDDLALYVGWSDGYDMADDDIIKSKGLPAGKAASGLAVGPFAPR